MEEFIRAINIPVFIFFVIYIHILFVKRYLSINSNNFRVIAIVTLIPYSILGVLYLTNIFIFNDFLSLNFGTDSLVFEKAMIAFSEGDRTYYSGLWRDSKMLHIVLYSGMYSLGINKLIAPFFVFYFNLLMQYVVAFTYLKILELFFPETNFSNRYYSVFFLFFNFISLLIVFSFLRDVFVVFIISQMIFLYLKPGRISLLFKLFFLALIKSVRSFYLFPLALTLFKKRLRINTSFLVLASIFTLIIFSFNIVDLDFVLRRLLVTSERYTDLNIDKIYGSSGSSLYSSSYLIFKVAERLALNFPKMLVTPLFLNNLADYIFTTEADFYFGWDAKILILLFLCIHNFYVMPMFLTNVFNYTIYKKGSYNQNQKKIINILLFVIVTTYAIYSIKFSGHRHIKIDYVLFSLILPFNLMVAQGKKNIYPILVILMIFLNIALFTVNWII